MPIEVTIHPTARIALIAMLIAVVAGSGTVGLKRLLISRTSDSHQGSGGSIASNVQTLNQFLLPVIELSVSPEAPEADWSQTLAAVIGGQTEVTTAHGRIDVATDSFAIEVDRLAKWHESIGQASHYAETTQKKPVVALIVLPSDQLDKIPLIEDTCHSKGIKLLILMATKAQQGRGAHPLPRVAHD